MNEQTVESGMRRLESISAQFDYDLALDYARLVQQFRRGMEAAQAHWPLIDVCEGLGLRLPDDVSRRLDAFLKAEPEYSPTVRDVCCWFLLELLAIEGGFRPQQDSIYEPLIRMLELGGHLYEHHGWLCIRDVASIPLVRHVPPQ